MFQLEQKPRDGLKWKRGVKGISKRGGEKMNSDEMLLRKVTNDQK